ncbi:MAG: lipopolysaccharide biosynthesis protein [Saprospiraceae bacterium]
MGVIQRQSIKYSIVNFVGLGIGTLSTLFVYPHVLEENGLMRFLLDSGIVLLPILSFGANTLTVRFFPKFEDKDRAHHGFLPLMLGLVVAGCSFFGLLAWVFWDKIAGFYADKSPMLREFLPFALPIAFFYVLNQVLFQYSANYKRIVVPSLLTEFSQKLILPALLIAVWQKWLPLDWAVYALVGHGAAVSIGLVIYLKWLGAWQWARPTLTPELRGEMLRYAAFWVLGGFALIVAARVDILMVGSLLSLRETGIFAIALQIAAVIEIPIKGLYAASVATVARHVADDNRAELGDLYQKVSINLLVAGLGLFLAIWVSLDSLFKILPNGEAVSAGKWVFFFIGLSRLIEMTTGLNNTIVYYSKYYAWSLVSLTLSAAGTIAFNLWLIPRFGIAGAAMASCLSIAGYNAFTVGLVWAKFGLQPFSRRTLLAVGLGLAAFAAAYFLPKTDFALLDIALHSGVFVVLFGLLVFKARVSADLNEMAVAAVRRFKS